MMSVLLARLVRSGKRRSRCLSAVLVAAAGLVVSAGTAVAAPSDDQSCSAYLPGAERQYGIPPGLLTAIALTESGDGGQPNPWALNVGGQPMMAESYGAAARQLRDHQGAPRQDMAVGCMQIYMRYHLANVGTPEWILQPRNNVLYAAAFLRRLYDQYGSWTLAVGHYNASDPVAQHIYRCQVARSLTRIAPGTATALALPDGCMGGYGVVPTVSAMGFGPHILFGFATTTPATSPLRSTVVARQPAHSHTVAIIRGAMRDDDVSAHGRAPEQGRYAVVIRAGGASTAKVATIAQGTVR